tara:strand:+ start:101 stop:1096 length:996 start_codon:yes stop_codon:yes gene_type:complete
MTYAAVIGAKKFDEKGGFGKHHARVLGFLKYHDEILIARTDDESSVSTAQNIQEKVGNGMIYSGFGVKDIYHLMTLVEENRPMEFISIATPDNTHEEYVVYCAHNSRVVFCEKPYSKADGDGSSLKSLYSLRKKINPQNIAINLPMIGFGIKMMKDIYLLQLLENAKTIRYLWGTLGLKPDGSLRKDVVDNLVLHPWSAIPKGYEINNIKTNDNKDNARIMMDLQKGFSQIECVIDLKYGIDFSGFEVVGKNGQVHTFAIKRKGMLNYLMSIDKTLEEAANTGNKNIIGIKSFITLNNPLQEHIQAAIQGNPIADLEMMIRSQEFLEQLKK